MSPKCCVKWLKCALLIVSVVVVTLSGISFAQQEDDKSSTRPRNVTYRLRKGDKIGVKFLYQPELNETSITIRPDGFISLQMVEEIQAEGMTILELKKKIQDAYSEQLLNPEVTVSLLEFVAPRVFVGGQVQKPGSYELRSAQTVLQAVIVAGGFTREAHRKMVLHARPVGDKELKVTVVDLKTLLEKSGSESLLQDGDYVFVPDSKLSKFSQVVDSFRFVVPNFAIR